MDASVLILAKDTEIISEYLEGDRERGATAFVRRYQSFVFSTALRYLKSYDDAEDAAQEAMIKALQNLNKFKGKSSLKTWLYRITVNVSLNLNRKKKILSIFKRADDDASLDIISSEKNPEEAMESEEFGETFLEALSQLPEKQRETFAMRYFEDLPYKEISDMLGTSVGGLKANYYQAVKKLSEELKDKV